MAKKTGKVDLKKIVGTNTLVIGTKRTIKELKKGNIAKVFIASNCPENVRKSIEYYCDLLGISCEQLNEDDTEFGVLCKKQFSICVAGVLKAK